MAAFDIVGHDRETVTAVRIRVQSSDAQAARQQVEALGVIVAVVLPTQDLPAPPSNADAHTVAAPTMAPAPSGPSGIDDSLASLPGLSRLPVKRRRRHVLAVVSVVILVLLLVAGINLKDEIAHNRLVKTAVPGGVTDSAYSRGLQVRIQHQTAARQTDLQKADVPEGDLKRFRPFLATKGANLSTVERENFLEACKHGRPEQLQASIQAGMEVNVKDKDGVTPLMEAANKNSDAAVIDVLLKAGADVNAKDHIGLTPLIMAAVANTNPKVISTLIMAGADINAKSEQGGTPLICAALTNPNPDVIDVLLNGGANVNETNEDGQTPLWAAAWKNPNPKVIERLVKAGARVNIADKRGSSPLLAAAEANGNSEVMLALIKAGAETNVHDNEWRTPLTLAVGKGTPELIAALLKAGADVNARQSNGMTPLTIAAGMNADPAIIAMLIKAGADVNPKYGDGITPLLVAARLNKNPDIITALIKAGAEVNGKTIPGGATPLMLAFQNPNPDIINVLIKAAADVNAKGNDGEWPLFTAAGTTANPMVIAALVKAGSEINAKTADGHTALMAAAILNKNPEVLVALIKAGADLHATSNAGKTALDYAKQANNSQVVTVLERYSAGDHPTTAILAPPQSAVSPQYSAQHLGDDGAAGAKQLTLDLGNGVNMKLVLVPAGRFTMGSPETEKHRTLDEVQHEVVISRPFYMGVTPVTQAQYQVVMGTNPSHFRGKSLPVDTVSWDDAVAFCQRLGAKDGNHYRLPTEAEWEYACRAGTQTAYNTGNDEDAMDAAGWYRENSANTTHGVAQKKPNAWGLYDMHGNIPQWCSDCYNSEHALRGGAWNTPAYVCRSASRTIGPDGAKIVKTGDARDSMIGLSGEELELARELYRRGMLPAPTISYPCYGIRLCLDAPKTPRP